MVYGANAKAFTLIEMILAIGVAAIVIVTICSVLFAAVRMRDATQDLVDSETPVDQTLVTMERDLQGAMTPTNGTTKVLSGDFRIGNITSMGISEPVSIEMFTSTGNITDSKPWGDVQRVTYELRDPVNPTGPGKDLIRTVTRNLMPMATPDVEDQWMMSGVQSITFSGYDGTQWWNTWDTTGVTSVNTNLPTAVKVDIQFVGNNNPAPIEFIVPVDSVSRTNRTAATPSPNG